MLVSAALKARNFGGASQIEVSKVDINSTGGAFRKCGVEWTPQYAELCRTMATGEMVIIRAHDRLFDHECHFLFIISQHLPVFLHNVATPKILSLYSASLLGCDGKTPPTELMVRAVIAYLRKSNPGLDAIYDPGHCPDVTLSATLSSAFGEKAGIFEHQLDAYHRFAVPISFDDYMAGFSKKRRYNLKRQSRLLEERFSETLQMSVIENAAQMHMVDAAVSKFKPPEEQDEARKYAVACINSGLMKSFLLHAGIQCVAFALGISAGEYINIHSTSYDPEFAALSPGMELWLRIVRYASEQGGYRQINLGFGDPGRATASLNVVEPRNSVIYPLYRLSNSWKLIAVTCALKVRSALRKRKRRSATEAPQPDAVPGES